MPALWLCIFYSNFELVPLNPIRMECCIRGVLWLHHFCLRSERSRAHYKLRVHRVHELTNDQHIATNQGSIIAMTGVLR